MLQFRDDEPPEIESLFPDAAGIPIWNLKREITNKRPLIRNNFPLTGGCSEGLGAF